MLMLITICSVRVHILMLTWVDSIDVWHGRLGHINLGYIKKMKECVIINSLSEANMEKCEICAETKITKKPCKSVTRDSELLSLVHSDLGDLKRTMTRVRFGSAFAVSTFAVSTFAAMRISFFFFFFAFSRKG